MKKFAFWGNVQKICSAFLILGILAFGGANTYAEEFSIEADVVKITTNANYIKDEKTMLDFGFAGEVGRSYSRSFILENITDEGQDYYLAVLSKDGEHNWLAFVGGQTSYKLGAGESTEVRMRMTIPESAEKGRSYYEKISVSNREGEELAEIIAKITIYEESMNYDTEVSIRGVRNFQYSKEIAGMLVAENKGNVGYGFSASLKVSPYFDTNNWKILEVVEGELTPGERIYLNSDLCTGEGDGGGCFYRNDYEEYGLYKLLFEYSFINNEGQIERVSKEIVVFSCPTWPVVVLGGVVLAGIAIFVITRIRKNKKLTITS